MKTFDGSVAGVEAIADEVVPQRLLRQRVGIPGVPMAYHRWELEPHAKRTLVIQHEEYRGAAVLGWSPEYVQDLYQEVLVALRDRVGEYE